jgi:hypothetical protein
LALRGRGPRFRYREFQSFRGEPELDGHSRELIPGELITLCVIQFDSARENTPSLVFAKTIRRLHIASFKCMCVATETLKFSSEGIKWKRGRNPRDP